MCRLYINLASLNRDKWATTRYGASFHYRPFSGRYYETNTLSGTMTFGQIYIAISNEGKFSDSDMYILYIEETNGFVGSTCTRCIGRTLRFFPCSFKDDRSHPTQALFIRDGWLSISGGKDLALI